MQVNKIYDRRCSQPEPSWSNYKADRELQDDGFWRQIWIFFQAKQKSSWEILQLNDELWLDLAFTIIRDKNLNDEKIELKFIIENLSTLDDNLRFNVCFSNKLFFVSDIWKKISNLI